MYYRYNNFLKGFWNIGYSRTIKNAPKSHQVEWLGILLLRLNAYLLSHNWKLLIISQCFFPRNIILGVSNFPRKSFIALSAE